MGRSRSTTSDTEVQLDLYRVAERAMLAPSILNTQPWRLVVHPSRLELFADLDRVVTSVDPQQRLMTISCGAALQHASVTTPTPTI
jgi:nitroreductase